MTDLLINSETTDEEYYFPQFLIKDSLIIADIDKTCVFFLPRIEILRYLGYNYKEKYYWFITEIAEIQFSMEDGIQNEMTTYYKQYSFESIKDTGIGLIQIIEEQQNNISNDMEYYLSYYRQDNSLIEEYFKHSENFLMELKKHSINQSLVK